MWSQTTWAAPDTNAAMCAAVHEQAHKWYQEQLEAQSRGSGAAPAAVVAAAKIFNLVSLVGIPIKGIMKNLTSYYFKMCLPLTVAHFLFTLLITASGVGKGLSIS